MEPETLADFSALPGWEIVEAGVEDLRSGVESEAAFLVAIGEPRLRRIGVAIPPHRHADPETALYRRLASAHGASAHSRYNALIRRLVSFERAAECARKPT